jgi:hypothetical protein
MESDAAGTDQVSPIEEPPAVNSDTATGNVMPTSPGEDETDDAALLAEAGVNSEDPRIHSCETKDKEDERHLASLQVYDLPPDGRESPEEGLKTGGKIPNEDPEIVRLRAELAASARRMELLQQKLRASVAPARTEFPQILYVNGPSNDPNTVTSSDSNVLGANKRQNNLSFIPTNAETNQEHQYKRAQQETEMLVHILSGDEADGSSSSPAKKTQPGDSTPPPKPQPAEGIACVGNDVSKKADAEASAAKRGGNASEAEKQIATSPYTGPGAGICHRRTFTSTEAGLALQKGRETGANVPLPPQPPRISAAVVGAPGHDDNVTALLKFWSHADVVAALAQTMSEDGAENLQDAHEHLVQQRDRRIAKEVRLSESEHQKDPIEPEEAIREDGELAAILAGNPNCRTKVFNLFKERPLHKK